MGGRDVTVNRQRQVEHQAYLTLFADREGATVAPFVRGSGWADTSRQLDEAQLMACTAVAVGSDRAIGSASAALGDEHLTEMTTFLQQAAMPSALRRALGEIDLDIDDLRKAAIAHVGAEAQELRTPSGGSRSATW